MKSFLVIFLFFAASFSLPLHGEKDFWNAKDAYLGQTPPKDIPHPFMPGLVTDPGAFMMGRSPSRVTAKSSISRKATRGPKGMQISR